MITQLLTLIRSKVVEERTWSRRVRLGRLCFIWRKPEARNRDVDVYIHGTLLLNRDPYFVEWRARRAA